MNYLQRFSAALAAFEARRCKQGVTSQETGDLVTEADWLSQIQTVARQLPPRIANAEPAAGASSGTS